VHWQLEIPQQPFVFWLLVLALLLAFASWAVAWFSRARRRSRARRALRAERSAVLLLERYGYEVEASQVERRWPVMVGRRRVEVALRADYLVSLGSQRFVAEVKSGALVSRIRHGPTRRQLLEYRVAYRVDGVLLVDVARARVDPVSFPELAFGDPSPITTLARQKQL
jgi:hypothetical protein